MTIVKSFLMMAILIIASSNNANAQFFKNLKGALKGEGASTSALDPKVSQSEFAKKWESKSYMSYTIASDGFGWEDGEVAIELVKAEDGSVIGVKVDGTLFKPDEEGKSKFVRFYKSTKGHQNLVFLEKTIILFEFMSASKPENGIDGKYYIGKKGKYYNVTEAKEYILKSRESQQADLDAYAQNQADEKARMIAERKEKYCLEGKKVKSIDIVDLQFERQYIGYFENLSFKLEATLENGEKISTGRFSNAGGFIEDYEISYPNATIDPVNKKVLAESFIDGDKIIIEAKLKYDKSIKVRKEIPLKYDYDITMSFPGTTSGADGHDFRVEVKQAKHSINGKNVLLIRLTDLQGTHGVHMFKMMADKTLFLKNYGANGYDRNSGRPYDGGDGGNITVIKDPNVQHFNIDYDNEGGQGGHSEDYVEPGRDGRDGNYKEITQSINF